MEGSKAFYCKVLLVLLMDKKLNEKVKRVSILAVLSTLIGIATPGYAQQTPCLSGGCFVSIQSSSTSICSGQSIILTADSGSALLQNDFNTSTLGQGWVTNNNVVNFNNPCGPGLDGTPHVWFGNAAGTGTRLLQTVDFNMIAGGNITFDFKMATQGASSPCEGPDEADEGVSLQFSTDYGATWQDIIYFSPSGTFLPSNPGGNNVVASGPTAFTTWNTYTFAVPPAAQTLCTRFRWFQPYNTSATNDHWGIDNVFITSNMPPVPGVSTFTWLDNGQPVTGPRVETPTQTTTYYVQYATPTDTCIDSVTVEVRPTPVAVFTGEANPCVGTPYNYSGAGSTVSSGTINNYKFILNPNSFVNYNGANNNFTFTYPVPVNTFNASLIVTSNLGCSDTATMSITVTPKPEADFTLPTAVCEGQVVNIDASASTIQAPGSLGAFVWDYTNDGVSDDSLMTNTTSYTATGTGQQTVELTLYNNSGCSVSLTKNIQVYAVPVADFTVDPRCVDAPTFITNNNLMPGVNYSYDFGDGTTANSNNNTIQHTYGYGNYTIQLIANQQNLCADTATVDITIQNDVIADFTFNEACNLTGIFTDASSIPATSNGTVTNWNWSFGNGSTDNTQNPTHTYINSADYQVQLIVQSSEGCFDTIIKTVPKYAVPTADFTFSEVCLGEVTKLSNTSTISSGAINTYNWNLGDGESLSNPNGDHSYDVDGAYNVTLVVVSDRGCADTITKVVNVWPVPTAGFTIFPPIQTDMLNPSVQITDGSTGALIYEYFIPNQGTYNEPSPAFDFSNSGSYTIFQTVANQFGCEDNSQMEYIVLPGYTFYVPSAFTPGKGDLINPVFQFYSMGMDAIDFRIFNRWGEEIFATLDPNFVWDGTYKGKELPMGIYAYRAIVKDMEGNEYLYSGQINLIR